ncbi:unnamed protein product [Caenorhabditis bovis]|uniref:Uncharacterized protein n=1 Tax=Caenorhabditis bovis TaxID=2654633 RepID=A0A8S1FFZ6_9PELO|nr:unnamed protein product [Caenorhabditis bovis]
MASQACPSTPYVGSGIKQDIHGLYNKFVDFGSLRIRDFGEVYRMNHFDKIYCSRISPAEYTEFAELLLQQAASYFRERDSVGEIRSLQQRIFGVYLTYALYSTQPTDLMVQVRVTLTQVKDLLVFQEELKEKKLFDAVACIQNLIKKNAFQISIFQSTYDPSVRKKELVEDKMSDYVAGTVVPFEDMRRTMDHDSFKELEFLHKTYVNVKNKFNLRGGGMSLVNSRNPLQECHRIFEKYKNGYEMKNGDYGPSGSLLNSESLGTTRSNARAKAYSAGFKHQRHRRYLDPNMEENFKQPTIADIAKELIDGNAQQVPDNHGDPCTTKRLARNSKRNPAPDAACENDNDDAIAMDTLMESQTALLERVKPDSDEEVGEEEAVSKKRTKVRAPKRKSNSTVRGAVSDEDLLAASQSPTKAKEKKNVPKLSNVWSAKLKRYNDIERAADKTLEKLQSKIKIEDTI